MRKLVDFLAEKTKGNLIGEVHTLKAISNMDILEAIINKRIKLLEEKEEEGNLKKLSKEQEIVFLKKLLLRLENE